MAAIYEWADHPHERVSLMRVRAGITDHAQAPPFPRAPTPFAEKPGQAPDR
jgi:hypothetical protein